MKQNFLLRIGSVITPPYLRGSKIAHRALCIVNKSKNLTLLLVMLMSVNMWGETKTYTMTTSGSQSTTIESNWTANSKASFNASGAYWACSSSSNTFTITSGNNITGTITKVQVKGKRNKASKNYTIDVKVGNKTLGSQFSKSGDSTYDTETTFSNATGLSGTIVITVNAVGATSGGGSFWITSITVTTIDAPSFTITPQSNNTNYGTVALDGSTITASPKSGYRISTTTPYTVTPAGSATVEQEGNEFTVTPTANCTIQINFEEKGCTDHSGSNVTSGTSTDYTYGPVNPYYNYSTRQILYTKTDLGLTAGKKGTIKSIYFEYASDDAITKKNSVKIYMANTNLTALSKSDYVPYSDFTEVYSGSFNCAQGWNEISLATPFVYNGSGSLVVLIYDNSGAYESSRKFKYHTANTTTGAQIYIHDDLEDENPSTTDWSGYTETNYRPNTKFCIEEADMTTATVTWYVNSVSKHSQTDYPGTACTAPTTPTTSDCDGSKVFVGWTTFQNYESENIAPSDLFTDPTTKTIPDGGANYHAVFANESISGKSIAKVVDNSFTGSYNEYCGMTYGLKTAGTSYVQKNSIWSGLTAETIKLNIKHISNDDADVLTISLIDNAGNNVVSTDVTTQTISSSKDAASYLTNPISLTATSAVTGYKIKLKTRNGFGTCIGEVSRVVEAAITRTNYATKCCTPWTAPTLTYTASTSIGAQLNPSWGTGTTHGTLTYSSSDEDILEVNSSTGVVTTKAAGTAHVIASWSSADDHCDNSTVSNDITVIAEYNITYKDKGGANFSGTHEDGYPQKHTYGTATTLKSASKDYYTFNGWFANESCTGSVIQTVAADAYTADFTLYAKWTPIVYNIKYTLNGGTNATSNPATYTYETATITLQDPSKTGHDFQGWFKEETFVNQVTTIEQGSHGDIDLFAEWSVKNYTLTWDLNGGSITTPGTTAGDVAFGTALTAPIVERTGYKFTGWKKNNVLIDFTKTVTMPAENATYVAQWTPEVYTISYKDQNNADYSGSNLTSLPETHTYNQTTTLVAGVKYGYQFDGWFGNSECTGDPMTSVTANTYSQDFTLYAKWTQIMPTSIVLSVEEVTLAYDGSEADKKVQVTAIVYPEGVSQDVSWSAAGYTDYASVYNSKGVCTITAKAEGDAIITCKSGVNDKVFAQVKVHVKHIPALTWLNADGTEFTTTKATALNNGKVVLPVVDDEHQPVTCDDEYPYFYGWSTSAFNAQAEPLNMVTAETDAPKDQTFYAVFAKGEGGNPEYVKVSAVTEGTYVLVSQINGESSYQYMPNTESASSNPALGNGITMKTEGGKTTLTNTITDAMLWDLNTSSETSKFYIQPHGNATIGLGTNNSTGDKIRIGADYIDSWQITKNDNHGWDFYNDYYLAVYSTTAWRNYGNNTTNQKGTFYLFQQQGGIKYISYLSSCCTGYDITLTDGGTKDHGTFAAVAKECATKPVTLTANPEYGYSLNAWTVKETASENPIEVTPDGTDVNKATFTMPEAAVTVDAAFVANHHNVLFHKIAGQPADQIVKQDFAYDETKALTLNSYERTGFKFEGWSSTGYSGEVAYTDGAEYTLKTDADVDLYAIWAADDAQLVTVHAEHMITDAPKEVSKTAESLSFNYTLDEGYKVTAVAVTVGTKTLTKNEIVFNQEGITITPEHNNFNNGAVVITFTVEEILYTVTLNPGSGTCEKTEVKQTAFGAAVTLPAATTIADGWTFAGWAAAAVPEETKDAPAALYTGNYIPAEDLTLFAVYEHCEEVEDATKKYIYDFESSNSAWTLNSISTSTENDITAHSGTKWGKISTTSDAYIKYNTALTGKYKITAYVARTTNNDTESTFSVKKYKTSWVTVGDIINIGSKTYSTDTWYELSWIGELNGEQLEIFYHGGTTAVRAIDDVTIVAISEDCKYHSTPSVVTSLKVKKSYTKNERYRVGDVFNPEDIVLEAIYDNDKEHPVEVKEGYDYSPKDALVEGDQYITFTYKGATCKLKVNAGTLDHLTYTSTPTVNEYVEGQKLNTKNLGVRAYYTNEAFESVTDKVSFEPSLDKELEYGTTNVVISYTYEGVTRSINWPITVLGQVATPTFSPDGGKLAEETPIVISCATPNATIYYTTDGTDPTTESDVYTQPVPMISGTLKAIATAENMGQSEVGKAVFIETIDPTNGDWMLVTDVNDLAEGDYLIIASKEKGWVAGKTEGQNLAHINATFSADKSILTYTANVMMFRLGGETGAWTLTNVDKEHLMGATAAKKLSWNEGTTTWSIAIDNDNNNNATIQNGNSDYGRMLVNANSDQQYFTTYTSATSSSMLLPQLYKYYKPTYKIIYDANGGINAPVPSRAENGNAVVTDQQPTWGGHEFVKWTENQDGSGKVYTATEEVTLTADLTIYAQWQEKQLEGTPVALVVKYNDKFYAMGKDLSAVEVLGIINGKVAVENTVDQKSITWYRNDVEDGVIFQNCEEKYLYAKGGGADLSVEAEGSTWVWNENGYYVANGENRTFIYREDYGFRNYGTSNIGTSGYSSAATCYEGFLVGSEIISRATAPGKIGTICMEKDIVATEGGVIYMPDYKDATIKNVYFVEATTELATPGMPFIFVGEADNMLVLLGYEEVENPVDDLDQTRGMVGSFGEIDVPMYTLENPYYCFQNNKLYKVGADTKSQGHRAYMNMASVPYQEGAVQDEPSAAPRRRLSMVNADADQGGVITGLGDVLNANNVQKLIINDKMYILRAGKMYDATGKFIK